MKPDGAEPSKLSPSVSVTLVVYNEKPEYLAQAVESVRAQSHKNFEFIIIDDSDDNHLINYLNDTVKHDSRIVYVHNEKRKFLTRARNQALQLARGEYVAIVDSDDIQHQNRLAIQLAFLDAHPDVGIVGSSFEKISEKSQAMGIRRYPESPESIKKQMAIKNAVAHPTVMIRREAITRLGFYDESFPKAEDYELWMRALLKGIKIANISEPLVRYRVSDVAKRDNTNWKYNLKVKLRYFSFDRYILRRIAGMAAVGLMVILPSFIKQFLYSMYNRIA
jgi:glycosyltransferase involved in cell wall biosynthesis